MDRCAGVRHSAPVPLTVSVLHDEGLALLALGGELDAAVTAQVQAAVDEVLAGGLRLVVVDLTGLGFCDSTGLGTLIRASRRVTVAGGACVLAGARGPVARLLQLLAMDRVLRLSDDVGEALALVRQDAGQA